MLARGYVSGLTRGACKQDGHEGRHGLRALMACPGSGSVRLASRCSATCATSIARWSSVALIRQPIVRGDCGLPSPSHDWRRTAASSPAVGRPALAAVGRRLRQARRPRHHRRERRGHRETRSRGDGTQGAASPAGALAECLRPAPDTVSSRDRRGRPCIEPRPTRHPSVDQPRSVPRSDDRSDGRTRLATRRSRWWRPRSEGIRRPREDRRVSTRIKFRDPSRNSPHRRGVGRLRRRGGALRVVRAERDAVDRSCHDRST